MSKKEDSARPQPEPASPATSGRGVARDLARARESGAASVAELKSFLESMRGKNPREMLGRVAQSGLVRSTIAATILVGILLVVFTFLPYGWEKYGWGEMLFSKSATPEVTDEDATEKGTGKGAGKAGDAKGTPLGSGGGTVSGATTKTAKTGTGAPTAADATALTPAGRVKKPGAADKIDSADTIIRKLGIGEAKKAEKTINPLESKADDLFEGIDG
jgi:hypothetical protein